MKLIVYPMIALLEFSFFELNILLFIGPVVPFLLFVFSRGKPQGFSWAFPNIYEYFYVCTDKLFWQISVSLQVQV